MNALHPYWLIIASAILAIIPVAIGICTSFVKMHIVLSFFRSGLGAQQVPSGLVIFALSAALSVVVMTPVFESIKERADDFPWKTLEHNPSEISEAEINTLLDPWYQFLLEHSGERELLAFSKQDFENTGEESVSDLVVEKQERVPLAALLPAFFITELREAFLMGFIVLIPFLVIDLIVANILAGVGMFMVSPVMISLPIKVALFVFADGWLLLTEGLTAGYL